MRTNDEIRFCPSCGRARASGERFCTGCGGAIDGAGGAAVQVVPAPLVPSPPAPSDRAEPDADGEAVIWRGRGVWWKAFDATLALFAVGVALIAFRASGLGVGLVCLSIPVGVVQWLRWHSQVFQVTTRALSVKRGLVSRRVQEMPLTHIESVAVQQGVFDRINRAGDVVAVGSGGTRLILPNIMQPMARREEIQDQVARLRR
jgi:membrane protein YdbS with pleckstrin-like domain